MLLHRTYAEIVPSHGANLPACLDVPYLNAAFVSPHGQVLALPHPTYARHLVIFIRQVEQIGHLAWTAVVLLGKTGSCLVFFASMNVFRPYLVFLVEC